MEAPGVRTYNVSGKQSTEIKGDVCHHEKATSLLTCHTRFTPPVAVGTYDRVKPTGYQSVEIVAKQQLKDARYGRESQERRPSLREGAMLKEAAVTSAGKSQQRN